MIEFIIGGSGSGKSDFAENLLSQSKKKKKYYLATMQVYDKEGQKKVERHIRRRAGKGFSTIERTTNIESALSEMEDQKNSAVLIECMSNLVANEMFGKNQIIGKEQVIKKILEGIDEIESQGVELLIVSNNIFEDGIVYDEGTKEYMDALGKINCALAKKAKHVYEIVVGICVCLK